MDKPTFENKIDLETSVSEQIADMQLARLREKAFRGELDFNDVKTLEILSKVKNTEEAKRAPQNIDPAKAKEKKMKELAASVTGSLVEAPKEVNEKETDDSSKRQRTS